MEDGAVDDLPLLETAEAEAGDAVLDDRLKAVADEESGRDSRDTPTRQTPVIQSIHCGCYLGRMIDVKAVARKLWNAVFDPKVSQPATSRRSALHCATAPRLTLPTLRRAVLRCGVVCAALSARCVGCAASSPSVRVCVSVWQGDQYGREE